MQKARFYDRMVFEINRYIVECKFAWSNPRVITKLKINRYIVGCKFLIKTLRRGFISEINRYIVECKFAPFSLVR